MKSALFRTILSIAAALLIAALSAQAPPARSRILLAISNARRLTVRGSLRPQARSQFDTGAMPAATRLEGISMDFNLSAAQQADLDALLAAQQNPASPPYHQWLTPAQFGVRFGMSTADLAKVESWLQQQGFTVDAVPPSRTRIRFSGTVAQVQSAFAAPMHYYQINGVRHFAPATALSLPAALAPTVAAIGNLDDFRPQPRALLSQSPRPDPHFTSGLTGNVFFAPADIATAYDIKAQYAAGHDGTGQTIAVVGQSAVALSDIEDFQNAANLTFKYPALVLMPGTGPATIYTGDEAESDLDLEWSGAVAPGANIEFVYVGSDPNYGALDALTYAVEHDLAPIISSSYGDCEVAEGSTTAFELTLQQAATQGQTVISAAGDDGSTDCSGITGLTTAQQEALAVDYPASSAYVTGVGGTEITTANASTGTYWQASSNGSDVLSSVLKYIPETAWNDDSATYGMSAGGGGASTLYTSKPSWQTGVPGIPADGKRDVPDLALYASPSLPGFLFCSSDTMVWALSSGQASSCTSGFRDALSPNGYLTVAGGTSADAPMFAGMVAIINQAAGYTTGQGLVNPTLYTLAASGATYASAFHDVTTGNNDCLAGTTYCSSSTAGFSAGTGYDQVTGLGSVDLGNLATAWPLNTGPTSALITTTTAVSASSSTPALNASVSFTVTVSSDTGSSIPAGTVTLTLDGTAITPAATLTGNGTAVYSTSFTTSGTHQLLANYSGDSTHAASNGVVSVNVPVVNSGTGSFALSTTFPDTAVGNTATQTVTITIPAGAVSVTAVAIQAGFPDFSLNSTTCLGAAAGAQCTADIVFQPTLPGDRTAPLVLTDASGSKFYFGLDGLGQAPTVAFTPGTINTVAGTYNGGAGGYSGDGGPATSAALYHPGAVAVDSAGNLFIADTDNDRLRKVDARTGDISTVAGGIVIIDLAAGAAGNVYVESEISNSIDEASANGVISVVAGTNTAGYAGDGGLAASAELNHPEGIAVDHAGDVFIADTLNNVIREVDASTHIITTVAGNHAYGFSGDGGPAKGAELAHPGHLAVDAEGDIYFADKDNGRIRRVDAVTGEISTIAGGGSGCTNAIDRAGDGCLATEATFVSGSSSAIFGLALDAAGNLYIGDGEANLIRRVDASTQIINPVAGDGSYAYGGDGGPATSAGLGSDWGGIAVVGSGSLYLADSSDDVIRKIDVTRPVVAPFVSLAAGQTSLPESLSVANVGNESLNLASLAASTDFALLQPKGQPTCAVGAVDIGTSCVIEVAFAPHDVGSLTGAVTLTDDALNGSPATQTGSLYGTGLQGTQTITFANPGPQRYGATTLAATASSGLPVTFAVTSGPATMSGATLNATALGNVTITASQAGNAAFTAATPVAETFAIGPAQLTVTGNDASAVYGAGPPALGTTFSGFVNGDTASAVTGAAAVTTTATAASPAGAYPITPAMGTLSSTNYVFNLVPGTLTVGKAPLTVAANDVSIGFGAALPTFTPNITGFVNGDTAAAAVTGAAVFSTTAAANSPIGTYPITASLGTLAAANYTFTTASATLTIAPATQSITFAAIANHVWGDAAFTLTATSSSGLPVSFSATGPATITGSILTITGAGVVTVNATQDGNASYAAATSVVQAFKINGAPLDVTASAATSTYGGALPKFAYALSGFVNGDTASVVTGAGAVTTTATAASPVGAYPITPAMGTLSSTNYAFNFIPGTLTVSKAPLTVAANSASMVFGAALPTFTSNFSGFVNGDTAATAVTGAAVFSTTATADSPVGTYPITAALGTLAANNYSLSLGSTPGVLTVAAQGQTITFAALPNRLLGDAPFALTATASSGLPVTFTVVSGPATVAGTTLDMTGAGTVTVEADQAGNANFAAAPAVSHSFTVVAPVMSVSLTPATLSFASQAFGTASASQSVTLTNTGQAAIDMEPTSVSGDFSETDTCSSVLAAGASCTVAVVFIPTATGARTGTITMSDSGSGSPQIPTVTLTGTGSDLAITAAAGGATTASVSAGQAANYSLSLTPLQNLTGTLTLSCTGAPKGATCTPSPASLSVVGAAPLAVSVSVTTTAGSSLPPAAPFSPGPPNRELWIVSAILLGLLAALMLGLDRQRARARRGFAGAALFGLMCLMAACGGSASGGGTTTPPPVNNATPSGAYTLTLKAADASGATVGAANLSLTVK